MSGFQFKQFYVAHQGAAMKVGTDGILLGSWAAISPNQRVLDIGTGSGLISLMVKQREPSCMVTAIEVDGNAVMQARDNVANSPWPDIDVNHTDVQSYHCSESFDWLISNPPFFQQSLQGPNQARNTARHTDSLSFSDLFEAFLRLGNERAKMALILPAQSLVEIKQLAQHHQVYISRITYVKTTHTKAAKRVLFEITKTRDVCLENEIVIHQGDGYHLDYINLCKDFYLKM